MARRGGGRGEGRPAAPPEADAAPALAVLRMDLEEAEPRNVQYYLEFRNALFSNIVGQGGGRVI